MTGGRRSDRPPSGCAPGVATRATRDATLPAIKLLAQLVLLTAAGIALAIGGWVLVQSLQKSDLIATTEATVHEAPEFGPAIPQLPRVRSFAEATFRQTSPRLHPGRGDLEIRWDADLPAGDYQIVVVRADSRAELSTTPVLEALAAARALSLTGLPALPCAVALVRSDRDATRSYLAQSTVEILAGRVVQADLAVAAAGDLEIAFAAGVAPPIVTLERADDPAWRLAARRPLTRLPENDGTLRMVVDALGPGDYQVRLHGPGFAGVPRTVTVAGDTTLGIRAGQ